MSTPSRPSPAVEPGSGSLSVIIVGAGFGGVAAAVELLEHGIHDVTLLEAAPELGGTWHHNSYPGAACDVPSHFYSFSYAQRPDWSRFCSPQSEILDYLRDTATRLGVSERVVTGTHVTSCRWDDGTRRWTVVATGPDGVESSRVADALVLATGQLNQPAFPRIEGRDEFTGHSFHSARWDHDYDLTGRRVAVIGTGASAVQFVPEIAPQVGRLTVFQRTGNWFLPRRNHEYPPWLVRAFRAVPPARAAYRAGLFLYMESLTAMIRHPRTLGWVGWLWSTLFLRLQLRDRAVRKAAWPHYRFGCKRVLFSSYFLPALQRENVELVDESIVRMTPKGPQTADGRVHEVDCVIYGTGFRTNDFMFPMEITGAGGRSLRDAWSEGPRAHLGITVPGFPSMFVLYGPNTNTSGGSIIFFLERQAGYVRQAVELMRAHRAALDVRPEVYRRSDEALQARFEGTAWLACQSWYRTESGRIIANWPGYMREYAAATRTLDPAEFSLVAGDVPAGDQSVVPAS